MVLGDLRGRVECEYVVDVVSLGGGAGVVVGTHRYFTRSVERKKC